MRRAAAAVMGTVAVTSLLIAAQLGTHPPYAGLVGNDASAIGVADRPSPVPVRGDNDVEHGKSAPASGGPGQAQPSTGPSRPAGTPATTNSPRTTPPTTAGLHNGSFTGTGVQERYGMISVTTTVSGGRVTDDSGICGGCNSQSQSIRSNAFSSVRAEALQAQSAKVVTVSGATYTSGAYQTSFAAALDAAHG